MKKTDKFKHIVLIVLNILNLIFLPIIAKVDAFVAVSLLLVYIILLLHNNNNIISYLNKYIFAILTIINLLFFLINQFHILDYIGSVHEIKNFVLSTKKWGVVAFIIIELLDVLVLPIPSFIVILAGVNIWGVTKTILICGITVVVGSCISFIIGKIWGTKAIERIVGQKKYNTYKNILDKHDKLYLSLMFIFPFFPDDLLCLFAGTTNIKFYEFLLISLFTRPISIIVTAILGDYFILLFEKYSIGTILAIIGLIIIILIIYIKNKNYIINLIKKVKRKKGY